MNFMTFFNAFWVGGLICVIGQLLLSLTRLTPARILVLFVVSGTVLSAIGIYEPLKKFAGAGASIPLTGFGSTLTQGVFEAIDKEGAVGILTGSVSAAAAGICAAVVFGFLAALIFNPKIKK